MTQKEKNYNEMIRFVKQIRAAFDVHGEHDLNDIPADDVINWADQILEKVKK